MKLVTVVGARPQFVKAATVSRVIGNGSDVTEVLVHTGQHFDENMSRVFFDELAIPEPAYNLGISDLPRGEMIGRMIAAISSVLRDERADAVLVYGDTNSTLAGAIAAAACHCPIVHVEAGLRSFNRRMPEELNRILTDHAASLLLCPTTGAVEQLRCEGFRQVVNGGQLCSPDATLPPGAPLPVVANVGDVMYDSLRHSRARATAGSDVLRRLDLVRGAYAVVTLHRAEATDDVNELEYLVSQLAGLARAMRTVFPLHPRTRQALARGGLLNVLQRADGVLLLEPQRYLDFVALEEAARVIVTDSGGVQKEAYWLGVPCVTLRDETEWDETVSAGWNRVVGRRPADLRELAARAHIPSTPPPALFGDGRAAERIVNLVRSLVETSASRLTTSSGMFN